VSVLSSSNKLYRLTVLLEGSCLCLSAFPELEILLDFGEPDAKLIGSADM